MWIGAIFLPLLKALFLSNLKPYGEACCKATSKGKLSNQSMHKGRKAFEHTLKEGKKIAPIHMDYTLAGKPH